MQKNFETTLLQSQIEVQETTFSMLAKELHDNVGQLLSSSKMLLAISQKKLGHIPETLSIAEETIAKAIIELRGLSKSMDKEWLAQFELIENLSTEIRRINSGKMYSIIFTHKGKIPLPPEKQIIIFRIIQEGLQNIIKHAEAKNIHLEIENEADQLKINIIDDGIGFTQIEGHGLGIRNMLQRTKLLGGLLEFLPVDIGSSLSIQIPLNNTEL